MEFEWDEGKNQSNITKHGVSFVDAKRILRASHLMLSMIALTTAKSGSSALALRAVS